MLQALYREVHTYAITRDRGQTPLTERKLEPRSIKSDLLLLGQGLARDTQPDCLTQLLARGGWRSATADARRLRFSS